MNKPINNSYRVTDQIFAGEYPGDKNEDVAKEKLRGFSAFGITHFIDLTEAGELVPYYNLLPASITHIRFAIRDTYVPECIEPVQKLIKHIWAIVDADSRYKIYIHCWGGLGRTGTIVGCLLAELYGYDYEETLNQLNALFQDCPKSSYRVTPENEQQRLFIARYIETVATNVGSLSFSDLSQCIAERLKKRLCEWHGRNGITLYEWAWLKKGKFPFECKGFNITPLINFLHPIAFVNQGAIIKFSELDASPLITEMERYRSLWESYEMTPASRIKLENRIEEEMWRRIMESTSYVWGG